MANKNELSRRRFLNSAAAVVTGTATGLVLTKANAMTAPSIEPQPEKTTPKRAKGYQRTEHVDTYYHLADF